MPQRRWKHPRELEVEIRDLFAQSLSDRDLRARLEALADERAFRGLTWLWGPILYRRNRILFRPFILARFSDSQWTFNWWLSYPRPLPWNPARLDDWLKEVEANEDHELFSRLYIWKMRSVFEDKARRHEQAIRDLLAAPLDDREMILRLSLASTQFGFNLLAWLWGPALFERNRVTFRSFLLIRLSHLNNLRLWNPWPIDRQWRGATGSVLEAWMNRVEAQDDLEIYQHLAAWRVGSGWDWQAELLRRFREAPSERRPSVLARFQYMRHLTDATATALYEIDADKARPYLLAHLPERLALKPRLFGWIQPARLVEAARGREDHDFYLGIYRARITPSTWRADVLELCRTIPDAEQLDRELERRHPAFHGDLGWVFIQLLKARGLDALPYVMRNLNQVFGWGWFSSASRLRGLAQERGWDELSSRLLSRTSVSEQQLAFEKLVKDTTRPDDEIRVELLKISSVFARQSDESLLLLWSRFPDLVRGPFKALLVQLDGHSHPRFFESVLNSGEESLIDCLAASGLRLRLDWKKKMPPLVEQLTERFSSLLREDPGEYAWRVANVLGSLPAYSIPDYYRLIRENSLARLLFARSSQAHLTTPTLVRDLLESPEIHVQILGLNILSLDDERSRLLAADNLDLLLPTLLRPLHRRTRLLAFRALFNAATTEVNALLIHDRARQALDLPDRKYPKEQLIGLLGRLLHRWPILSRMSERPVVHGRDNG